MVLITLVVACFLGTLSASATVLLGWGTVWQALGVYFAVSFGLTGVAVMAAAIPWPRKRLRRHVNDLEAWQDWQLEEEMDYEAKKVTEAEIPGDAKKSA